MKQTTLAVFWVSAINYEFRINFLEFFRIHDESLHYLNTNALQK